MLNIKTYMITLARIIYYLLADVVLAAENNTILHHPFRSEPGNGGP